MPTTDERWPALYWRTGVPILAKAEDFLSGWGVVDRWRNSPGGQASNGRGCPLPSSAGRRSEPLPARSDNHGSREDVS